MRTVATNIGLAATLIFSVGACDEDKLGETPADIPEQGPDAGDSSPDAAVMLPVEDLPPGGVIRFTAQDQLRDITGEFWSDVAVPDGEELPEQARPVGPIPTEDSCADFSTPSPADNSTYQRVDVGQAFRLTVGAESHFVDKTVDEETGAITYALFQPEYPDLLAGGSLGIEVGEFAEKPALAYKDLLAVPAVEVTPDSPVYTPGTDLSFTWTSDENAQKANFFAVALIGDSAVPLCACTLVPDGAASLPAECLQAAAAATLVIGILHQVHETDIDFHGRRVKVQTLVGEQIDVPVVAGPPPGPVDPSEPPPEPN